MWTYSTGTRPTEAARSAAIASGYILLARRMSASLDWATLFLHRRADWQRARLLIVGHALLEQLATAPRKALTAFVWAAGGEPVTAPVSAWAARPLLPLPVLGVPGWWADNQDPGFYGDSAVFRPAKALPDAGVVSVPDLKPRSTH